MKAIIFGVNGQDGYYLTKLLAEKNIEVIGVSRTNKEWVIGDIADRSFVDHLISSIKPNYLFHLAANSTVQHDALFENHATIATGSLNLLESVYVYAPNCKVFLAGSGLQFCNNGHPINETDPFDASSPYAIARIQGVYAARYFRKLGVKTYIGYLFNHDSAWRSQRHVNQKIIYGFQKIVNGSTDKIDLFDIVTKKEFGFAKDIAKGIWTLVAQDEIFECVIGTGIAYSIADWLTACSNFFGIDWHDLIILADPAAPSKILVSDPSTINGLGWKSTTTIDELAHIMILNER